VNDELDAPGLRIVHVSAGRLRIHCPDPDGSTVARLRRLPGVIAVSASELTGNILIQFDARLTRPRVLCAELGFPASETGSAAPVPMKAAGADRTNDAALHIFEPVADAPVEPGSISGFRRRVYKTLGWTSVGLAGVGAVTPGLPTVPFALLAGYFFVRSSPAAHAWLLRSRWLGPAMRDWEEHRGVKRSVKYTAVTVMGVGLAATVLAGLPPELIAAILALEAIGLVVVLRLPEVPPSVPAPAAPTEVA
jgi:uncharacterized membrane protein YbaN (DUF454 family)